MRKLGKIVSYNVYNFFGFILDAFANLGHRLDCQVLVGDSTNSEKVRRTSLQRLR